MAKFSLFSIAVLLTSLGTFLSAHGQAVQVDNAAESTAIAQFVEYYEDASELLRVEDILAP